MIRAFVFDLDGTLVETEELKALSYARAATELRPDLNEGEVAAAFADLGGLSRQEGRRPRPLGANPGPRSLLLRGRRVGDYLERLKWGYRRQRDALLGTLGELMPKGVSWTEPEGGFFVWVTLPEGIDAAGMLPEAVGRGVAYVPGADFYPGGWGGAGGRNVLRLSFAFAEPTVARRGVEVLSGLVREKAERVHEGSVDGTPACGCGSEGCACAPRFSCTEELVGGVGC